MNLFDDNGKEINSNPQAGLDKGDLAGLGILIFCMIAGVFVGGMNESVGMGIATTCLCYIGMLLIPIKTRNTFGYLFSMGIIFSIILLYVITWW
jgi:hypothetical protein